MRTATRHDRSPLSAYLRENELLMARRIPLALSIFLNSIAVSGILEYRYYPQRIAYFLGAFGAQAAVCLILLSLRRALLRRHALSPATVVGGSTLALLMIGYATVTEMDSQLLGTALVCLLAGMSMLLPWRAQGQTLVTVAVLLGFGVNLLAAPQLSLPAVYAFFAVFIGSFIAVLGAHYLDIHRFAIFQESLARNEAAHVTRALLQIAGELNADLDAGTVLDRIARSTSEALACDWSWILLWDERREVFRIAAGVSQRPNQIDEAYGIELGPDNFPLIKRLIDKEDLIEVSDAHPGDEPTMSLMAHFHFRALLAASMVRAGRVVGLMMAGRTNSGHHFLPQQTRLARGIAQQAAVTLENARLVTDLRHADRMKTEFMATMSHELRTPLNIIIGYNDLLSEGMFGELTAEQRDVVERVRQNSTDLLTLINATLDVNRLEAGKLPLEIEEFSLTELLDDVRSQAERMRRADCVTLHWEVHSDGRLRSDPRKIKIILRNLIANALKFSDAGRVTIQMSHLPEGSVEFTVADTGIGIPNEELSNIFGMFQQVHTAVRQTSGVGLGLYIVQQMINQLQGDIHVHSTVGKGTTFRVRIPHLSTDRNAA